MLIQTTRFGTIEIDESRIITFRDGILGFPGHTRYALIQTGTDPVFFWLQSTEDPALAFVVCDPAAFVPDYQAPTRDEDRAALQIADDGDSQTLVIVNKTEDVLTGNLLGPLVIGARSLLGRQLVGSDRRWSTRHELVQVGEKAELARTA